MCSGCAIKRKCCETVYQLSEAIGLNNKNTQEMQLTVLSKNKIDQSVLNVMVGMISEIIWSTKGLKINCKQPQMNNNT